MGKVNFVYSAEEWKFTELAGVKMIDYYNDINLMVASQKKAIKTISSALNIPPQEVIFTRGHVKDAEYMGCGIYYPEDNEPFVKSPVLRDIREVESLKVPDPPDNPFAREYLKKARQFYELTGIKSSAGMSEGPFTTAAFMRGQTQFMVDWIENPHLCEKLIEVVTGAIINWKKWHDVELGVEPAKTIGLVDDSITLISPQDFEKKVFPYLMRWFETFPCPERHFHCCGDITRHMEALARLNLTHYVLMGEMVDILEAKRVFKGTHISQLFDFRILRDGTEEKIICSTRKALEHSSVGGDFDLVVEGTRGIPLEKVVIVKDTVNKFNQGSFRGEVSFEK